MIAMWGSVLPGVMTLDTVALVLGSEKMKCTGRGVCTWADSGSKLHSNLTIEIQIGVSDQQNEAIK